MPEHSPRGSFQFRPGIRLVQSPQGGIILQANPLRALKVNRSAYDLLNKCRAGYLAERKTHSFNRPATGLPFLDMLHQAGLLDWTPAQPRVMPLVSIVIPVFSRPQEIEACLDSLLSLDYPADKIEVIVVDDASRDHTPAVVRRYGVQLIVQPRNMGQSAARNTGVAAARGEIIAFMDSDCTAQSGWLRDLVPYFQDPRVALVGGFVDTYDRKKRMDRYEQVCSALNMGQEPVLGRGDNCVFYVPTCNMLVRRQAFRQVGGLDESLHVGEDVDLCWRLMAAKHHLLYIPRGHVQHKHRNRFLSGFLRRFDYGTSEAVLYARFPRVVKQFPWQPAGIGMILAAAAALADQSWPWLVLMAGLLAVETGCKRIQLRRKMDMRLSSGEILAAVIKSHFQLAYYLSFYMVRYHLLPILVLSFAWPSGLWLYLAVIFLPTLVVYIRKRPRLSFPVFAFFYLAEHAFYQCGAFWGSLKQKNFRLYRISFRYAGFICGSKQHVRSPSMAIRPTPKEAEAG